MAKETKCKPAQSRAEIELDYMVKENSKLSRQLEKARLDLGAERKMRRSLARNHAGYDDLLKEIGQFTKALGSVESPRTPTAQPHKSKAEFIRKNHSEDAMLVISDTHFGDRSTREDSSGLPEFDLEIAGARLGYVVEKTKQILTIQRSAFPLDTLYVPILGDIVHGTLHDSPQSNEILLPAQIHFSYHMLRSAIEDLASLIELKIIKNIVLLFSVGNHARLEEAGGMPIKMQAQRTFDWVVYQLLIDHFKGRENIECRTTMSPFIFENIRGWRYMFSHGLGVGFKNRIDAQTKSISNYVSALRAVFDSSEYRKATGLSGATFDRCIIGDVHIPMCYPHLLSNGSLSGPSELGVNWRLETIPAGQTLIGISKSHPQTFYYFLDCTSVQRGEDNAYAKFAREYARRYGRYREAA